jgi:hypothetical protein
MVTYKRHLLAGGMTYPSVQQQMLLILTVTCECSYRLDPDEEGLSVSDSDDSGDDIRPQTSGKGGEVINDGGICDAAVNSDEAASGDTCSDRKPEDAIHNDCKLAVEAASK